MQFDWQSKTTWAMVITGLCGFLAILGVNINQEQQSSLVQAAVLVVQVVTLVGPVAGVIFHQRSKTNAQKTMIANGMPPEAAKTATKS